MGLAVFDIDGTLVAGPGTEKRLFALLARRGWLKPPQLLAFLRFGASYAGEYGLDTWKKNKAYLAGLRCRDVEALVADWVRDAAPGWWYPPALERLRRHQAAGDVVVVLSGTPQFVLEPMARALGVARAIGTLCATDGDLFLGHPPLRHPFGVQKRELFADLCAEFNARPTDVFSYADSRHDLPMLHCAGHPVAVRPDAGLRAAAVAGGWEILGKR